MRKFVVVFCLEFFIKGVSQPYTDLGYFNYLAFSTHSQSPANRIINNEIYAFNILFPLELYNRDNMFFSVNSETIQASFSDELFDTMRGSSVALALGYYRATKSNKWKSVVMLIPKLDSDIDSRLNGGDFKFGFCSVESFQVNNKLQIRAGLYFNKEGFGHFWLSLLGVDRRTSDRSMFYGTLPTNYVIEYAFKKRKRHTALQFKAFARSFQHSLEQDQGYICFDEVLLKGYVEDYFAKNMLAYVDVGSAFGSPQQLYQSDSVEPNNSDSYSTLAVGY